MATKLDPKITLERTYNIPLRKEFMKVPRWRRTKKAVNALRQFLEKHMKSEDVKLSKQLNQHVWKNGIRNPPHHVKVNVSKDDTGMVRAELFGAKPPKEPKKKGKETKKKSAPESKKETPVAKEEKTKTEVKKE
jgi:large subunit ribosomal protein L31e